MTAIREIIYHLICFEIKNTKVAHLANCQQDSWKKNWDVFLCTTRCNIKCASLSSVLYFEDNWVQNWKLSTCVGRGL